MSPLAVGSEATAVHVGFACVGSIISTLFTPTRLPGEPGCHVSPPIAQIFPYSTAPATYPLPRPRLADGSCLHRCPPAAIGSNSQVSVNTEPVPTAEKPPKMYSLLLYTA